MTAGDKSSIEPATATGTDGGTASHSVGATPSGIVRHSKAHAKDRDMGAALKTVYQQTIDEAIPQDLLDLLGKLS